MQLFLDGSDIDKIRKYSDFGVIDGVTTNPSIILKSGKNMIEVISELASVVSGSVSAEVSALDSEKMVQEGMKLSEIAKNVTVKLPITWDGLKACNILSKKGISHMISKGVLDSNINLELLENLYTVKVLMRTLILKIWRLS